MIQNVALCYSDSPDWPKMRWIHDGFTALGLVTRWVRTVDELKAADAECDMVVFQNKSGCIRWPNLSPVAEWHQSLWAQVWCDLIATDPTRLLEEQHWFRKFAPIMQAMDLVTVKERSLIPRYRELGVKAEYLDQGAPPCREIDRSVTPEWDVLFWGHNGREYAERHSDIRALVKAGFRVAWATRDAGVPDGVHRVEWTHPDKLPALASRARCVLSVDLRHDLAGYFSDRFWMATAMGCVVLRRETPGMPIGPYWTYRNHEELIHLAARVRNAPDAAAVMGKAARQWALTNHSIQQRCESLLHMANQIARSVSAPANSP